MSRRDCFVASLLAKTRNTQKSLYDPAYKVRGFFPELLPAIKIPATAMVTKPVSVFGYGNVIKSRLRMTIDDKSAIETLTRLK